MKNLSWKEMREEEKHRQFKRDISLAGRVLWWAIIVGIIFEFGVQLGLHNCKGLP